MLPDLSVYLAVDSANGRFKRRSLVGKGVGGIPMASSIASSFSSLLSLPTSAPPPSKTLVLFSGTGGWWQPRWRPLRRAGEGASFRLGSVCCASGDNSHPAGDDSSSFCIIEGPETIQDFVQMQLQEIEDNIRSRRNKIFLLMEEVRRLRVQQHIKSVECAKESTEENEMPDIPSTIPFLSHMTPKTLKQLYMTSFSVVSGIIVFGGLLAPILELKLGLGGTSYEDFIHNIHLPMQLSQVDPIVASFSGGAVGVISALMLAEAKNVEQQEKKRCKYCHGTGYLACARCSASGVFLSVEPVSLPGGCDCPLQPPTTQRCPNCSGAGKVMCPTCLCTGMDMASEHDPRIDPFD
ncbi:protein ORANGE-LIKE, chloroplastic-like [Elaeis guineensis]|uniref:Protein ORANGE-LIKE, chloroplastic n=1 Tax=Elaeis guineensis var. tenera TaxID=51953 RepID=A0A6I9RR69_ELAGV|nr:protein ORANGE-LIKE, chloroplastic [Elaeis guineensis]